MNRTVKKRLLIKLFCTLGLFSHQISYCQTKEIDSLLNVLTVQKEDSVKVRLLNNLSEAFIRAYANDKGMDYALAAMDLSEKLSYKKGKGMSYNAIGSAYYNFYNLTESLKNCLAALEIFEELKDRENIALTHFKIGNIYYMEPNDAKAIKHYFMSLKLYEELNDLELAAIVLGAIGNTYYYQEKYSEAGKAYDQALEINKRIGHKNSIAYSLTSIGNILWIGGNHALESGDTISSIKKYNTALVKIDSAVKIFRELKDEAGFMLAFPFLGNVYEKLGHISINKGNRRSGNDQLSLALKYYHDFLEIASEANDKNYISEACNGLGRIYSGLKQFKEARKYLDKALQVSTELGLQSIMKDSYDLLTKLDSSEGNFKKALEHFKSYVQLRDTIINAENSKKIVSTQMQYEFDKKEALAKAEQEKKDVIARKELQRQKLLRNGFLVGFVVVLLFAGVFFAQRNKIQKGKKRSDELLLNILPADTAEELKITGTAQAKDFDQVTVMFTDFKNFTHASEKMSAHELVFEINRYFSEFDRIISRFSIEKIKTIGDSYMCAGGLPVKNKTNAEDVVKAALEICRYMHERISEANNLQLEIRIGIHTGPVVAGIVGIKKFAYDIWGDTVNIASRMESSGESGKVNISGTTHELIKDKFVCSYRGKIQAKNKGEIDMYFVVSPSRLL